MHPETFETPNSSRLYSIDVIKGLAILGVLAQHATPGIPTWIELFSIDMAVPVFMILMGVNAAMSAQRRPMKYSRRYIVSRLQRLIVPFVVIWLVAVVIGLVRKGAGLHVGALTLIGALPVRGPGNYFVPISIAFAASMPLLLRVFKWSVWKALAIAVVLNVLFELAAAVTIDNPCKHVFVYEGNPLRFLTAVVVGFLLVQGALRFNKLLIAYAVVGFAYLLAYEISPKTFDFLAPGFAQYTNLMIVGYAALWVLIGVRAMRSESPNALARGLATLGQLSYHVFLVQIVWFAAFRNTGVLALAAAIVGTIVLARILMTACNRIVLIRPSANA